MSSFKNVLLLFGFQDKCPIAFVLSRTFVLLQSKWKWAPDTHTHKHTHTKNICIDQPTFY